MKKLRFSLFALGMAALSACNSLTPEPEVANYLNTVWVVCEGNFSDADGDVSVYFPEGDSVITAAYEYVNGAPFAGTLQSATFANGKAYLVDNAGSRIVTVDAATMESENDRSYAIDIPRFLAVSGDRGFLTAWGPYDESWNSPDSEVALLDMTEGPNWESSISVPSRPEQILEAGGRIWLACAAASRLISLNPTTGAQMSEVLSYDGVSAMVTDANGKLWVLSTSEGPNQSQSGGLFRYNPDADSNIEEGIDLATEGTPVSSLAVDGSGQTLYYIEQVYQPDWSTVSKVYAMDINATSAPTTPLIEGTNFSAVGVHPTTGDIYVADNQAFQAAGIVRRYSSTGDELGSFTVGRGPNAFHFPIEE